MEKLHFVFLPTYILMVINIKMIIGYFTGTTKGLLKINVYAALCVIFALSINIMEAHKLNDGFILIGYSMLYLSLFTHLRSHHKCSRKMTAYVMFMHLLLDSLAQCLVFWIISGFIDDANEIIIMRSTSLIINILFFTLFYKKFRIGNEFIKSSVNIISNKIYVLILLAIAFISLLITNQTIIVDNIELQNTVTMVLTVLSILTLLITIFSLIFICIEKSHLKGLSELLEKQVVDQVEHYENLKKKDDNLKEFKHDYMNHMHCIQSLLKCGDNAGALNYIKDITNSEDLETDKFRTQNKIAGAILSGKSEKAKTVNAEIDFDGIISELIPPSDMCIILSNALDNAIEACEKTGAKDPKKIEVKCAVDRNMQIMRITNPVTEKVEITDNAAATTKKDRLSHGFGLYNIKKTVEKYKGDFSIKSDSSVFILELGFQLSAIAQT